MLLQDSTSSLDVSDSFCAGLAALSALTSLSLVNLGLTSASSAECWTALVALRPLQYLALTDHDEGSHNLVDTCRGPSLVWLETVCRLQACSS